MRKSIFFLGALLMLTLLSGMGYGTARAEEAAGEKKNSDAEESVSAAWPENSIEITVNLEDEARFMGISLFLVGEYDGEHFVYSDEVRSIMKKEYYLLDRVSDQYEAAQQIAEYIEETGAITSIAGISVKEGIGTVNKLPNGLYLLVQNDEDFNSKLTTPFFVEAPTYSSDTSEYLFDIKLFPKWERVVWFSFRPEVVNPIGIVGILLCCLLLALFGWKLFRMVSFVLLFGLIGFLGMKGAMSFTDEYLWYMVVFVSTAFLGIGVLYGLYHLTLRRLATEKVKNAVNRQLVWFTPILAFVIAAATVRYCLSEKLLFWLVIPGAVAVIGFVIQLIGRRNNRAFYTYEDLLAAEEPDERG